MGDIFVGDHWLEQENERLRLLLAAAALELGGRLCISDRSLLGVRKYSTRMWRDSSRLESIIEVQPRKEPDVQYHHDEKLSGEVVLDAVRAERADSGDQRGLCDQGLLPSNGEEIGDDVETDPDC